MAFPRKTLAQSRRNMPKNKGASPPAAQGTSQDTQKNDPGPLKSIMIFSLYNVSEVVYNITDTNCRILCYQGHRLFPAGPPVVHRRRQEMPDDQNKEV